MRGALTPLTPSPPPGPPPPARPVPPRNTWPRHATGTRRAHQWEIDRLVDGVMEYESPAHAPRFPYRLGIHGTVWRFRLTNVPAVSILYQSGFIFRLGLTCVVNQIPTNDIPLNITIFNHCDSTKTVSKDILQFYCHTVLAKV